MTIEEFQQCSPEQQCKWLEIHKILTNIYISSMKKASYPWHRRWNKQRCRAAYMKMANHELSMKFDRPLLMPKELQLLPIIKWALIIGPQLYLFVVPMLHKI